MGTTRSHLDHDRPVTLTQGKSEGPDRRCSMGLPARQRRMLERIESALRGSDPKLAALYAIFARLNRDEEMPRIEQLRHSILVALARLRRAPVLVAGRLHLRLVPRQRAVLFFPLALALLVAGIVYAAKASSGNSCVPVKQVAAEQSTAKSKLCRPPATPFGAFYAGK